MPDARHVAHPGHFQVIAGGSLLRRFASRSAAHDYAREVIAQSHANIGEVQLQRLDCEYDWQTVENYGTPEGWTT